MTLPRHSKSNVTSKIGVNFVRTVIETSSSIFTEIPQQNDLGIDGIVEIIKDEHPTGHCIGVQIKSGKSFFNLSNNECQLPVENHALYWSKYPLPVFGIVYVPERNCCYWVNIKTYLKNCPDSTQIKFSCTKTNIFDLENFNKVFMPFVIGSLPEFEFDEAFDLFRSKNQDEKLVGLVVLFRKYSDRTIVWDEFMSYFRSEDENNISRTLIYYLAHIPWHPDIFGGRDKITPEIREYAKSLIRDFSVMEIIKLLSFIDENGIERGSIGQSVEAIISLIPNYKSLLREITKNEEVSMEIREWADVIRIYRR